MKNKGASTAMKFKYELNIKWVQMCNIKIKGI